MEVYLKQCHNSELFLELITRSRQLENCHRTSCGQRDYLESQNKDLRDSIQEQNKILDNMTKKHIELKKRANSIKREDHHELKRKRISVLSKITLVEAKEMYEKLIQQILETKVKAYLKGLLTPTSELSSPELDQMELYKIYGLLLSACRTKVEEKNHSMLHEEAFSESGLDVYRAKADILTHNMLKLLPPLLVVCIEKQQHGFNKELYDTFRPTWDDTKGLSNTFCYRPVLFYGNQHCIAVKGLVGNCEKPHLHNQWDSSTNQDLVAKKDSDETSLFWSGQHADTTYQTIPRRNSSYFGQQKYSKTLSTQGAYGQSHFSGSSSITKQCAVCAQTIMTFQMPKQLKKDQFIHRECYVCCICNKYIETTNAIILDTGQLICFRCNKCCRCKQAIDEKLFKYQGAHMTAGYLWHKNCFKCSACYRPLDHDGYCLKCGVIGL